MFYKWHMWNMASGLNGASILMLYYAGAYESLFYLNEELLIEHGTCLRDNCNMYNKRTPLWLLRDLIKDMFKYEQCW